MSITLGLKEVWRKANEDQPSSKSSKLEVLAYDAEENKQSGIWIFAAEDQISSSDIGFTDQSHTEIKIILTQIHK